MGEKEGRKEEVEEKEQGSEGGRRRRRRKEGRKGGGVGGGGEGRSSAFDGGVRSSIIEGRKDDSYLTPALKNLPDKEGRSFLRADQQHNV